MLEYCSDPALSIGSEQERGQRRSQLRIEAKLEELGLALLLRVGARKRHGKSPAGVHGKANRRCLLCGVNDQSRAQLVHNF